MSICADCEYYEEVEREFQAVLPEYPTNEKSLINKTVISRMHYGEKEIVGLCNNPKRAKVNCVTGDPIDVEAEVFNEFGQCELFVEKDGEVPEDVPEYPSLQIVCKNEIETEEEIEIKCYAKIKSGNLSYKWFIDNVEIEGENGYSVLFSAEASGNYTLKCQVTNTDNTCKDRQTSTSYIETEIVVTEEESEDTEDEIENTSGIIETPSETTTDTTEETSSESDYF